MTVTPLPPIADRTPFVPCLQLIVDTRGDPGAARIRLIGDLDGSTGDLLVATGRLLLNAGHRRIVVAGPPRRTRTPLRRRRPQAVHLPVPPG